VARIDFKKRVIQAKLVYYGPGLCGKTTNLEQVNTLMGSGEPLMSLATQGDRTIFFDFMPLDLGQLRGMDVQFKLYTVPGQVRYNQTRKMVLKNVDGIVFVADSQQVMMDSNIESLENMYSNLEELGLEHSELAIVLQYNKRDLPDIATERELDAALNAQGYPTFPASAFTGSGVVSTLKEACRGILGRLQQSFPEETPDSALHKAPSVRKPKANSGRAAAPKPLDGETPRSSTVAPKYHTKPPLATHEVLRRMEELSGQLAMLVASLQSVLGKARQGDPSIDALGKLLAATQQDLKDVTDSVKTLATKTDLHAGLAGIRVWAEKLRPIATGVPSTESGPNTPDSLVELLAQLPSKKDIEALHHRLDELPTRGELTKLQRRLESLPASSGVVIPARK